MDFAKKTEKVSRHFWFWNFTTKFSSNCSKLYTIVNYNPFFNDVYNHGSKCFEIQEVLPVAESADLLRGSWRCGGRTKGGPWSHTGPVGRQEAWDYCSWWSRVSEAAAHNKQVHYNACTTIWFKCRWGKKKADATLLWAVLFLSHW